MFSILHATVLSALLPAVVFCAPQKRATSAPEGPFHLHAYGKGIGGMPLFFDQGLAFAGNPDKSNHSDAAVVSFVTGNNNAWIGSPVNKTTDWAQSTLFVPTNATQDTRVGFLPPSNGGNSSTQTSGFSFYGNTAMLIESDGSIQTLFTGLRINAEILQIYWNDTRLGQVPITLRSIAPSILPPGIPVTPLQPANLVGSARPVGSVG